MTNLITEARELIEALHAGEYDDEYIGTGAYLMLNELCDALEKHRWIPVTERLPESGEHVLLSCEAKPSKRRYTCDGFYAAKLSINAGYTCDLDADYDEEKDEFFLPEGYYEVVKNWDEYGSIVIDDFVTHWMPLPAAPEEGE